jgi:hypothetical protein
MLLDSLVLICFVFPGLFEASTSLQAHRISTDPSIENLNRYVLGECASMLESIFCLKDEALVQRKREFLVFLNLLPLPHQKKTKKEKPSKTIAAATQEKKPLFFAHGYDYYPNLNYPTCLEALELSVDVMTAEEAVYAARKMPNFFYTASSAIMEAISDYSAFGTEDIKMSSSYTLKKLLDIKSAVITLHVDSLVALMANYEFVFSPKNLENLKTRTEDLILYALNDARLLYQYFYAYFTFEELKAVKASAAGFQASSSSKKSKKKSLSSSSSSSERETEIVFDNTISVDSIKKLKPSKAAKAAKAESQADDEEQGAWKKYKILAFS